VMDGPYRAKDHSGPSREEWSFAWRNLPCSANYVVGWCQKESAGKSLWYQIKYTHNHTRSKRLVEIHDYRI